MPVPQSHSFVLRVVQYTLVLLIGGLTVATLVELPVAGGIAITMLVGAALMGLKFSIDNSDPSDFNDPGPPGAP